MLKRIRLGKKQRHYLGSRLLTVDGLIDTQLSADWKEFIEIVKGVENIYVVGGNLHYGFEYCRQAILKEVE